MPNTKSLLILKNDNTLILDNFIFRCAIGQNKTTNAKIEGDRKTPKGKFNIGKLFYRKDRVSVPNTELKCIPIKKTMCWCNDINSKENYNKLINCSKKVSYEKLYRHDYKYNFLIPILFNTKKIKLGKGSAIFIHLTNNYKPTAGCITLKHNDFMILLRLINKNTQILIT